MKPYILVVDDEQSMQELLSDVLKVSGFDVSVASDSHEFKDMVFARKPDAIILDIVLGDKDGIQTYDELVKEGLDQKIPVIFLSALAKDCRPAYPEPGRHY